jgi:hypothetical protein
LAVCGRLVDLHFGVRHDECRCGIG